MMPVDRPEVFSIPASYFNSCSKTFHISIFKEGIIWLSVESSVALRKPRKSIPLMIQYKNQIKNEHVFHIV